MNIFPKVSVICLCYNQSTWVEEAVTSVLHQTYPNIQLIVIDDASTDDSLSKIRQLKETHPSIEIILLDKNQGNCRAFNLGLKLATGDYIIDFAADDVMISNRIEEQINFFKTLDESYGVIFTDAEYINAKGEFIRMHYDYLKKKKLIVKIPEGDVYRDVVSRYFISSPTMMIKKEVLDLLGGYDETLTYEDFDFWVRSSRQYKYAFLNKSLTKVRRTENSMSTGWYQPGDRQLHSTYLVCRKALLLNRDEGDVLALLKRIRYEHRQSIFSGNYDEGKLFYGLLRELNRVTLWDRVLHFVNQLRIPMGWVRRLYHLYRFG